MVSIRPHFPTMKHTPAKESKVHNGGGPYPRPDLRISWSLHAWGSPARTWDSRSITVGALTVTLILFPQLFWGPSPLGTALSASQILPTKDLRDLLTTNYSKSQQTTEVEAGHFLYFDCKKPQNILTVLVIYVMFVKTPMHIVLMHMHASQYNGELNHLIYKHCWLYIMERSDLRNISFLSIFPSNCSPLVPVSRFTRYHM